ncbi:TRAP transporter substrate-binding protein DctP [Oleidesulfovibrio sp.]|uniref:TRAP transporter substrate-binding protein n=1 Tax=Oleidesulfovibrio sp. TaxID=2909707 RepID=UPI003A861B98
MKRTGLYSSGMKRVLMALVLALAVPVAAMAATTVKMCYNGPPSLEDNAVHAYASTFKELVEKASAGAIIIDLYPNSQLGNEQQRMEQVMTGPMINVASFGGMETVFPEMFATNIPFMFESYAAAHKFFDSSSFMEKANKELRSRTGIELLAVVEEGGFIAFTSKKPIKSPADFKGMKFRAMDASQVAMYEAFGASGTPIPWTEVYLALKTGVADGQMNPPTYIIIGSLYEVQEYLTLANVQYSDQFLLINGEFLDSLSAADQQLVRKAAHEANVKTREFVESQVDDRVKFLADKGMKVYTPNAEEMAQFKALGSPSYIKWLSGQIDQSWIDHAMEDAKKANEGVK